MTLTAWKLLGDNLTFNGQPVPLSSTRPLKEMSTVLQNPDSTGPNPLYRVYRGVPNPDAPDGYRSDVTVLEPGLLGKEYTKTHGHYHLGDGEETYQILAGEGSLLLQKPGFNFDSVESVRLVSLHPKQPVTIPTGWGHTLINTGEDKLVTLNYQPAGVESFYAGYDKKQGAAYYVTKGTNGPELEPNPKYSDLPKIQTF